MHILQVYSVSDKPEWQQITGALNKNGIEGNLLYKLDITRVTRQNNYWKTWVTEPIQKFNLQHSILASGLIEIVLPLIWTPGRIRGIAVWKVSLNVKDLVLVNRSSSGGRLVVFR